MFNFIEILVVYLLVFFLFISNKVLFDTKTKIVLREKVPSTKNRSNTEKGFHIEENLNIEKKNEPEPLSEKEQRIYYFCRFLMNIIISLSVFFGAMYIILSKEYDEESQKWAFGAVGSIIGFWARPEGTK